ncbi:hypothetical protein FV139_17895 [Parahaliea maris]|uniref:UDP-GlcNAc:undecaprenyl-phosphate GlcNAc-1-phosphate transferase n=1 Tax=Parahaliea maris TaxID=2716870 RepID=A0A5C8ZQS1_9GAMM|nr:hypothetical protein [Parahaliea maris]TXS90843.1 hypothetical protein FV139_17895 [Parahaliea maris]
MSPALQQALFAFLATLGFICALAQMAPKVDLVDKPNHRKLHQGDVPLIGGLAIFMTLAIATYLFAHENLIVFSGPKSEVQVLLLAAGLLVALGVIDDRKHVSVFTRTSVEVVVALIVIEGLDLQVAHLGDLVGFGHIQLNDWLAYPFTVICIFGIINAYNMLDGMDGLLAMMVLITILAFHLFTGIKPGLITLTLSASLVAFLVSNLKLAPFIPKTFLGDAGSKLLGFIVVSLILAVTSAQIGGTKYIDPVTALYLVGLPLFDMVFTTTRRVFNKQSPFNSDRTHIHHLMQSLGLSHRRSLLIIGSIGLTPPFLGLMLHNSGAAVPYQFYIFLGCFCIYCVLMSQAWKVAERYQQLQRDLKATNSGISVSYLEPRVKSAP